MCEEKRCLSCNKILPATDFYKKHSSSEHRIARCKSCFSKASQILKEQYYCTYKGLKARIWKNIQTNCRNCDKPLLLDKETFFLFIEGLGLRESWVFWKGSNYAPLLRPRVYKLDRRENYTLDNIRIGPDYN